MPYGLESVQKWIQLLQVLYEDAATGNTEELAGTISAQLELPSENEERCLLLAALAEIVAVCEDCADGYTEWIHPQRPGEAPCTCGACARCALERLCTEYPLAVQAAIVLGVARICDCEPPPRVKSYYPAVLVNELPALLHGEAAGASGTEFQMLEMARRRMPGPLDAMASATSAVSVGFGKDVLWPGPKVAEHIALATCVAEPPWRSVAMQLAADHTSFRGEERRHVERLTTAVARTQQTYELLSPPEGGWVRLLLDFKLSVLAGAQSWLKHRNGPKTQGATDESKSSSTSAPQQQQAPSAWHEVEDVILHEVVMFLQGTLDLDGSVRDDHYLPGARNDTDAGRQRLKRARHRTWWSEASVREAATRERPDPDDLEPHCLDAWLRRKSSTICDLFCMHDELLDILREVRDRFDKATTPTSTSAPTGTTSGRGSQRSQAPQRCKGN
ncbi:MAG: hypothetical protein AMXMBFR64_12770 [Myxococcales bacterium]